MHIGVVVKHFKGKGGSSNFQIESLIIEYTEYISHTTLFLKLYKGWCLLPGYFKSVPPPPSGQHHLTCVSKAPFLFPSQPFVDKVPPVSSTHHQALPPVAPSSSRSFPDDAPVVGSPAGFSCHRTSMIASVIRSVSSVVVIAVAVIATLRIKSYYGRNNKY